MSSVLFVFFFKQKTAYEMRISDWSSDVCSSDLDLARVFPVGVEPAVENILPALAFARNGKILHRHQFGDREAVVHLHETDLAEIGRASCRERVCQYV